MIALKVPDRYLLRGAVGGALVIEAFVLGHEYMQRVKQ
jgi:hypothetical protein